MLSSLFFCACCVSLAVAGHSHEHGHDPMQCGTLGTWRMLKMGVYQREDDGEIHHYDCDWPGNWTNTVKYSNDHKFVIFKDCQNVPMPVPITWDQDAAYYVETDIDSVKRQTTFAQNVERNQTWTSHSCYCDHENGNTNYPAIEEIYILTATCQPKFRFQGCISWLRENNTWHGVQRIQEPVDHGTYCTSPYKTCDDPYLNNWYVDEENGDEAGVVLMDDQFVGYTFKMEPHSDYQDTFVEVATRDNFPTLCSTPQCLFEVLSPVCPEDVIPNSTGAGCTMGYVGGASSAYGELVLYQLIALVASLVACCQCCCLLCQCGRSVCPKICKWCSTLRSRKGEQYPSAPIVVGGSHESSTRFKTMVQ